MIAMGPIGAALWRVATIIVPVPAVAILAISAWLWFDKSSAIRKAVNEATIELVAGSSLAAAKAETATMRLVLAEVRNQLDAERARTSALADAVTRYAVEAALADKAMEGLNSEIAELESRPVSTACRVDRSVLDRLRAK